MSVVLVVGSTGAGKTTYAHNLSKQMNAAVFSIDDWMKALYWQDMPQNPDNKWFVENGKWYTDRIKRCEDLILKMTIERSKRGESSILDLGFSEKKHRANIIKELQNQGARASIHYLDVPVNIRWQRVQERNMQQGQTFAMTVDKGMFDYVESIFEAPQPSEGPDVLVIR